MTAPLPGCVLDWVLCAGVEAGFLWGWWRAGGDGWSPSGAGTTELRDKQSQSRMKNREETHMYVCNWLTGSLLTVHSLLWARLALSLAGVLTRMTHLLMRRPGRQHPRTSLQHRVHRLETVRETEERFLKAKHLINTSALKRFSLHLNTQ